MKANAPEKIYAYIPDDDIVGTASTQKGFPHQFVTEEYTRTDAFIEKACEWLEEHLLDFWSQRITNTGYFIEDFKNYMKGE